MNTLNGKKCLITGASSGLGLELTKLLIRQGAEVIMLCRNESKAKEIVKKQEELRKDVVLKGEMLTIKLITEEAKKELEERIANFLIARNYKTQNIAKKYSTKQNIKQSV